jgi:hypothetical protein
MKREKREICMEWVQMEWVKMSQGYTFSRLDAAEHGPLTPFSLSTPAAPLPESPAAEGPVRAGLGIHGHFNQNRFQGGAKVNTKAILIGSFLLGSALASAQSADKDPVAIVEVGAATSWNVKGGAATFGPDFAVECTPIENWLEIEAGTTPFFTRSSTEWDTDVLFKKPWTLSKKAEFMFGVGPEWVYVRRNGAGNNSVAGEAAGDFMFWPTGKHRFGWYLEPAYDYNFSRGHEQSIGMSAGLLIAIP